MKERETKDAPRPKSGRSRRRASSPAYRLEEGVLCPEDFRPDEASLSWAEKRLPPATFADRESLTEQFVRKFREIVPTYLHSREAWQAKWKNFMQACGNNQRDSAARSGGRYVEEEVPAPTYAQLVAAGHVASVPSVPVRPVVQACAATTLDDKCPSF